MPFRTVLARLPLYAAAFAALPLTLVVGQIALPVPRVPTPQVEADALAEPPIPDPARPTAVFLVGNQGTEISDLLPPFAAIAGSGAFNVVTVAPSRRPSPLLDANIRATGLSLIPDYALDDFDAVFQGAPELVVVPYIPAFDREDRMLVAWLRDRAGPQTVILTICAGTTLAAETGLMEAVRATSHFRFLAGLRARHPGVRWTEGVRYIEDGRFISSGALLAGVDAALAAVHRIAGEEAMLRAAASIQADASAATEPRPLAPSPNSLRSRLHEFFGPSTGEIGLHLTDGANEMMVAAVSDMLGVSVPSPVRSFADAPGPVRTRFGLTLLPELAGVEPGRFSTVFESLTAEHEPAFEVVLDWIAAEQGTYPARRASARFAHPTPLTPADGSSGDARVLILVALLGSVGAFAFGLTAEKRA
jgi:putative intracellular protease/amidase